MERHYTDGTEPTSLPHLDPRYRICRGFSCYQGRQVCQTPEHCTLAAEASTELGADEPTARSEIERILVITIVVSSCAAVIGFIGGLLS